MFIKYSWAILIFLMLFGCAQLSDEAISQRLESTIKQVSTLSEQNRHQEAIGVAKANLDFYEYDDSEASLVLRAMNYLILSRAYHKGNQPKLALNYMEKAASHLNILSKVAPDLVFEVTYSLVNMYAAQKNFAKAEQYCVQLPLWACQSSRWHPGYNEYLQSLKASNFKK